MTPTMSGAMTAVSAKPPATVRWEVVDSPLGEFLLAGEGPTLVEARLPGGWSTRDVPKDWVHEAGALSPAARQLGEYFDGTRKVFDLAFAPRGTAFQLSVWK